MSDYCMLFSQTFYGLLFSCLTITDITSYIHHKFPVSFLQYIATKTLKQTITVNSSTNAPITPTENNSYIHALRAYVSIVQIISVKMSYCLRLKSGKYCINDISGNIEAVFLKPGTTNVHRKRNKMIPLVLLP